jgi:PAS domain S-box-containing protein
MALQTECMSKNNSPTPVMTNESIAFSHGGGDMGAQLRAFEWTGTPLGHPASWSTSLRTTISIVLNSRFPSAVIWGPDLITIYNDAFKPILGGKPEALGRSFREIWKEAWDTIGPIAERAFQGEATFIENFPLIVERNGYPEQAYFTFCYSPVRDESGTVVGMIDTVIETTETVLAKASLAEMNVSLETQVEQRTRERDRVWRNSLDILVIHGRDGIFRDVNPAWTMVLGHETHEVVGHSFLEFVHPEDAALTQSSLETAMRENLTNFENRYLHKDGSPRWIAWMTSEEDGLVYAYGRHITAEKAAAAELEQAREALRQSQKMEALGQLTGGVAHDFNNLLQAIGGNLELIERRLLAGQMDVSSYTRAAQLAVDSASAMTQRLLAFARRQPLQPRSVDLNALVIGMEDLIRRSVGLPVLVDLKLGANLPRVWSDANQIESALLNLAINARDAMPEGGRLTIETAVGPLDAVASVAEANANPEPHVRLSIVDTGTGMNPDVLARAFEPFFTTKPIGQGTGLGLSQIYGFVHQSGGHIDIDSTIGKGTTVTLWLPCSSQESSEEGALKEASKAQPSTAGTVLVVEDEALVRMVIVETLSEQGYAVLEADDGASALRILESAAQLDLLITDVGLPGMNGRQVAELGRRLRPGLKVLFLTGYAHSAGIQEEALGLDTQLVGKPVALDVLLAKVGSMLNTCC